MNLKESTSTEGWDKLTVQYATSHRSTLVRIVKKMFAKAPRTVSSDSVDEVIQQSLQKMYLRADYSEKVAREKADPGKPPISLENYVGSIVKHTAQSYLASAFEEQGQKICTEVETPDGDIVSVMDILPDKAAEEAYSIRINTLKEQLKLLEPHRYRYGLDLYLLLYIASYGLTGTQNEELYRLLNLPSIKRTKLKEAVRNNDRFKMVVSEVAHSEGVAPKLIGKYIHARDSVDRLIEYVRA